MISIGKKPIDNYILDFFCHELMLGIEVDGITHQDEGVKEKRMREFGIVILRFSDEDVLENMDYVLETLRTWVARHTPPSPC